jgi:hypothetical protein
MTYPPDPYGQRPNPASYPQQPYPPQYGQPPYGYGAPMQSMDSSMAIGSMVCSIVGLVMCPVVSSIIGVVLGHVASAKSRRGEAAGQGMALAGIVIGYVTIFLWVAFAAVWITWGAATNWHFYPWPG